MKKFLSLAGAVILAGTISQALTVTDNFDWGAGVSGRTAVTSGQSIAGLTTQTGGAVWTTGQGVFCGGSGSGNGLLDVAGVVNFGYVPVSGWSSEVIDVTVKGFFDAGTGTLPGIWFGFQQFAQNKLLNRVATDKLFVRLAPNGGITFRSVIGGVTNNAVVPPLSYAPGELLTLRLSVDAANKRAALMISGESDSTAGTLNWTPSSPPQWGAFAVNQTGGGILMLDSVCVGTQKVLPVYVFAGQSNMAGAGGNVNELPAILQKVQPDVFVFDGTNWLPLKPSDWGGAGPEISFAYNMQQTLNQPIGVVLHAVGGTSLATNWNPEIQGNLYAELVGKVQSARQSRGINIRGMLWMQGERDSKDQTMASAYAHNLGVLIYSTRRDFNFNSPGLPFVAGRVNPPTDKYPYVNTVRTAQETCAKTSYAWINCDDLTKIPDGVHYNTAGQVELGKRFSTAILNLQ
jgi:hypothetical protein